MFSFWNMSDFRNGYESCIYSHLGDSQQSTVLRACAEKGFRDPLPFLFLFKVEFNWIINLGSLITRIVCYH